MAEVMTWPRWVALMAALSLDTWSCLMPALKSWSLKYTKNLALPLTCFLNFLTCFLNLLSYLPTPTPPRHFILLSSLQDFEFSHNSSNVGIRTRWQDGAVSSRKSSISGRLGGRRMQRNCRLWFSAGGTMSCSNAVMHVTPFDSHATSFES